MQCGQHKDQHYDVQTSIRDGVSGFYITQVMNKGKAAVRVVLWISLMKRWYFTSLVSYTQLRSRYICSMMPNISPWLAPQRCWRSHSSKRRVLGHCKWSSCSYRPQQPNKNLSQMCACCMISLVGLQYWKNCVPHTAANLHGAHQFLVITIIFFNNTVKKIISVSTMHCSEI